MDRARKENKEVIKGESTGSEKEREANEEENEGEKQTQ